MAKDDTAIIETIDTALAEEFELDPAALVPEADIRADLGLDSLDIVDMVIVLERAFGIKLKDRQGLAKIRTLGDIHAFIISLRGGDAPAEG